MDGERAQPVVQVFTEAPVVNHPVQVAVRGRHHADVGVPRLGAADAPVGAGFQQAQQLDLHRQRNVAHLVQKQRAAAGGLDQAGARGGGPGEGAALMAEQLGLEQVFRQAGAVHRHQRAGGARTGLVHRASHQFLAGAGFALQQYGGHRWRDPCHQGQHVLKHGRTANQPLRCRLALGDTQGLHLLDEIGLLAVCVK